MSRSIATMLDTLVEHDPTLALDARSMPAFAHRRLRRARFSRSHLFRSMARSEIAIYGDYPFPVGPSPALRPRYDPARVADELSRSRSRYVYALKTGASGRFGYRTLGEIMQRWNRRRSVMGITDLHIRGSRFERLVDLPAMNAFNVLRHGSNEAARLEMPTGVISSRNNITDSHSDDPDGSNHCFVGRKLWLLWDTFEGLDAGLEDVERVDVYGDRAAFDMEVFLSLPSARWFVIGPGETVFVPGRFTHKVITLEDYIGVGGFYVSLPNCLQTLSRWILDGPLWERNEERRELSRLIRQVGQAAARRVRDLAGAPASARERWGHDFVRYSARVWRRQFGPEARARLLDDDRFGEIASEAL